MHMTKVNFAKDYKKGLYNKNTFDEKKIKRIKTY
jgi:hypothetical protein